MDQQTPPAPADAPAEGRVTITVRENGPFRVEGADLPRLRLVDHQGNEISLEGRKALSLCFSVWWFGNGWNARLGAGAGMVFLGSLLYTAVSSGASSGGSGSRGAAVANAPAARGAGKRKGRKAKAA